MSKIIRITDDILDGIKNEFCNLLETGKFPDGKIEFSKSLATVDKKAKVYVSEIAWLKMWTLISEFEKEVAWHGTAVRGENPGEYYIKDILVYPQEVTGATVTTDQQKYEQWLKDLDDDTFNNLCFQGHSHVNMGTTPSAVDTALYDGILQQLDSDKFYIFMIWNKRREHTVKIYDYRDNVLYENNDTTVSIVEDGTGIEKFVKEAKEMVTEPTPASNFGYGQTYNGYGNRPWYGNHGYPGYNAYADYDDDDPWGYFSADKRQKRAGNSPATRHGTLMSRQSGKQK